MKCGGKKRKQSSVFLGIIYYSIHHTQTDTDTHKNHLFMLFYLLVFSPESG